MLSDGSASINSLPSRIRPKAATTTGSCAVRRVAARSAPSRGRARGVSSWKARAERAGGRAERRDDDGQLRRQTRRGAERALAREVARVLVVEAERGDGRAQRVHRLG